ncbi:DMT family transporter [Afifella sp. IM 167]|uniref:DMT family transporter n=1 Tax=Afifella sp. IM 167 TaxID=2033586 RepID=UPI001CD0214D|nr:DMT family transporter [Afifella sp. IM 167]MBZ8133983.1 EamA family transporter [Afifella sp. IM 167]
MSEENRRSDRRADPGADRVVLGIVLIVGAVFAMSLQDALIKYASTDMSLWQIYVLRALAAFPALLWLARRGARRGGPDLNAMPSRWAWLRAGCLVAMYVAMYAAIPVLSLSVIAAAFYTGPLFITLLSAPVLGERVGARGWLAVLLGFSGVAVMLRPGGEAFAPLALLPVLSGFFYALAAILTRAKCRSQSAAALAFALNGALLAAGLLASLVLALLRPGGDLLRAAPFLLGGWAPMGAPDWALILFLAALIVFIGLGLAAAYQAATPSLIATFDYSYLVFAAFWGWALFADLPDAPTLAGMAMIAGAGLLAIRRRPAGAPGPALRSRKESGSRREATCRSE